MLKFLAKNLFIMFIELSEYQGLSQVQLEIPS